VIWLIVIAIESTTLLSGDETSRILWPILHYVFGVDAASFPTWHFYIRKVGHVVGYAILSWVLFTSWRATLPVQGARQWAMRWARIAFFMSALVASLDEWHQAYLPSRTGAFHDVVLDSSAALLAQIIIYCWIRSRSGARAVATATSAH
jgi:VanZ family protein